jgi:arylformamidase
VDALPLQTLVGQAYVADLTGVQVEIGAQDLDAREIPANVKRLMLKTRNGALWAREGFQKDFVALNETGAQWVVERGIRLVGMDYLGADLYTANGAPAHDVLLNAGVVIVEGLMLEKVEMGWYTLVCLPLKVQGADGAPARAILLD